MLLWGGWLVVTAATFSYMNGIVHPYYTVALAPAVAAAVGIGVVMLWERRTDVRAATTLSGIVLITAVLSFVLLQGNSEWLPWLRWAVLVVGVAAAPAVDRRRALVRIGRDGVGRRRGSGRACRTRGLLAGHRGHPASWGHPVGGPRHRASADRRDSSTPAGPAPR